MNTQLSINVDQSFLQPALALSLSGTTDVGRDADYWRLGNLSDFSKQDPLSPRRFGDLLPSLTAQSLSQQSDASALAASSALSHSSSSQTQDGSKKKRRKILYKVNIPESKSYRFA